MSHNPDSPRLARDALVLGDSAALNRNPTPITTVNNTHQAVLQPCVSQNLQPLCLAYRSEQLQEQGFTVEVAERIAVSQRSSIRTVNKSKWALFEKWCRENLVDFSSPSVKQVLDSFMYLFQDLNRCPSTIDDYRTAIVDSFGPAGLHISHTSDLNRLLTNFHRERPKSSEIFPNGTSQLL